MKDGMVTEQGKRYLYIGAIMNLGETYFNTIILYYKILSLGFICKILISCEA